LHAATTVAVEIKVRNRRLFMLNNTRKQDVCS
jgi:hypothetical protein